MSVDPYSDLEHGVLRNRLASRAAHDGDTTPLRALLDGIVGPLR